ncbi:GNAT family N-acetyltransferase [Rhizobium panacihumi]|uniref:GNAT family N-acetyltransferase n=1 Tax=Rhizobium panacihumi TaxID=2008450 RepID=UPI003D798BBD
MPLTYKVESLTATSNSEDLPEARRFCLRIIRDFYGIDYNADWHADLDSLTGPAEHGWYCARNGGAFRSITDHSGRIIATGGLYNLDRKPATAARLADRFGQHKTCQIARVYLDPAVRGTGLGSRMVAMLEDDARALGYATAYLHADAQTPATLAFWAGRGYGQFGTFSYPSPSGGVDRSVDFDKSL